MSLLGDRSASFIIRIWRERGEGPRDLTDWRGSIECVDGGERAYFRDLNVMRTFLNTHLRRIGIEVRQDDAVTDSQSGGSARAGRPSKKRQKR